VETTGRRYWDHRTTGSAAVGLPLTERSAATISWQGTSRAPLDPLPADAAQAYLPTRGFFSSVGAGWRYGAASSSARSISPERGRSVALGLEITPSWLGSWTYDDLGAPTSFDQLQATAEGRWYVAVPGLDNHVLALRSAGGLTLGDGFRYGSYRLGGNFSETGLTVLPTEWRMLRGFFPASDSGQDYVLASAEYRFPIVWIDRGFGTLPLFLRDVSGAVFMDAGDAFDELSELQPGAALVGTGAELRGTVILGWGLGIATRAGYAFAVQGDGIPPGSPQGFYASLGSSF
jgi:outer membrane protein assembly factor BamA